MKRILYILLIVSATAGAQNWWGAAVGLGHEQPYTDMSLFDLNTQDANNQLVPLFLSSDGEYMWSDKPFNFTVKNGTIRTSHPIIPVKAGNTLRDANNRE